MLQLNAKLKALIDKLWDRFWSGGISNPLSAIEQITYLLFMKQLDELDLKRQKDAEFTGDTFTSRFSGEYFLPSDTEKKNPDRQGHSALELLQGNEGGTHVAPCPAKGLPIH